MDGSYTGGNTSFTFEIYNYENNLLFNTSNVDIPYTVEFWLPKEPDETAKYYVNAGDRKTEDRTSLSTSRATFKDTVEGGAAVAKKYTISIEAEAGHEAVPIYVRVQTLQGSLINRTLTGKMLLTSAGKAESYIESNQFVVPEETGTDERFAALQEMAGFTYEIRTAGTVTTGELTEKLKVSWDTNVLQIDLFDEAYLEWLKANEKTYPNGPVVDSSGWCSIEIDAMPYASENIGFFRGTKFKATFPTTSVDGTITVPTDAENWENLHNNYIKVEKVDMSS